MANSGQLDVAGAGSSSLDQRLAHEFQEDQDAPQRSETNPVEGIAR
jgi:hypothetical protein